MEAGIAQSYLSDVLHAVAQSLLAPDIILLLLFIGYALFSIGSAIAEVFSERRHFKVVMPRFLAALMAADEEDVPAVIEASGLLKRQKAALNTVYEYRDLPGDALVALVKRLVSEEESRYDRISGRDSMAAKVAPMLGLMGTLIPLGPGVQALGQADTAALSSSLLVAFDTTVAGLVTAAICLVVGKIRTNWYNDYLSALDASMATMLEKIEYIRDPDRILSNPEERMADLIFATTGVMAPTAGDESAEAALAAGTLAAGAPAAAAAYEPEAPFQDEALSAYDPIGVPEAAQAYEPVPIAVPDTPFEAAPLEERVASLIPEIEPLPALEPEPEPLQEETPLPPFGVSSETIESYAFQTVPEIEPESADYERASEVPASSEFEPEVEPEPEFEQALDAALETVEVPEPVSSVPYFESVLKSAPQAGEAPAAEPAPKPEPQKVLEDARKSGFFKSLFRGSSKK